MSDGLIGAASIFTRTSDPPIAASSWFFSLSTKPKRDVSVTQARQAAFRSNHLPKVGQVATVRSGCYCVPRNQGSVRRERLSLLRNQLWIHVNPFSNWGKSFSVLLFIPGQKIVKPLGLDSPPVS